MSRLLGLDLEAADEAVDEDDVEGAVAVEHLVGDVHVA
jgi:hypothetical protein